MADLGVDFNQYEDITVPVGCDMQWGFIWEPLDATGTSAVFLAGGNSYTVVITITNAGDDASSQFQVHLTPSQLAALGLNVSGTTVGYTIQWTDTTGAVNGFGYGTILGQ